MDSIPTDFLDELPECDDRWEQVRQRHTVFCSVGCFPKAKEALFTTLVESPFRWIPVPVFPDELHRSRCLRIHTLGFRQAFEGHPELCIDGLIPPVIGRDLLDALTKLLPIAPGSEVDVEFGLNPSQRYSLRLSFSEMVATDIEKDMKECADFYRFYFDRERIPSLRTQLPESFVRRFDPQHLDAAVSSGEVKICGGCGCEETASNRLKVCRRCQKKFYCSRECQLKDWRAGHSRTCLK